MSFSTFFSQEYVCEIVGYTMVLDPEETQDPEETNE